MTGRGTQQPLFASFVTLPALLRLLLLALLASTCLSWGADERRTLRVVIDNNYPPFMFIDPDGRPAGYAVDYWHLWEGKTGIHVDLQPMQWGEAQRRLLAGKADAIDLIFRTPAREPLYDFTASYADVPVAIYSHSSISGITDIQSLRGFQIGVMAGDACIDTLREGGVENLRQYPDYLALIDGALAEDVKIFCLDEHPANYYVYQRGAQKAFRKAFQLYQGHFHRAVRKGDAATLRLIEQGASRISEREEAALRAKWMPEPRMDLSPYGRIAAWGLLAALSLSAVLLVWLQTMRRAVARRTAELHDSEDRFRHLFEDTLQAIALIEDGRFVAANRASLRMFGTDDPLQLVDRTPADISPKFQPDGQLSTAKATAVIDEAMTNGSADFEWLHLHADGSSFTSRVLLTPIRQQGKILLHVVWSDISEQKAAEKELETYRQDLEARVIERTAQLDAATASLRRVSEEQRAILDGAGVGIMLIRERTVQRCNRRLEELFAYDAGEMNGLSMRALYAEPGDYEDAGVEVYAQVATGDTYTREFCVRRKDGQRFWVRMSARALDAADLARGIVAQIEDISTERAATQALHQASLEQEAILDSASAGIILIRDRRILRCNRRADEMLGYASGEQIGQSTRQWFANDSDYEAIGSVGYPRIWRGETYVGDWRFRRKDGSLLWVRESARAVDPDDPARGVVVILDDITDERLAADALNLALAEQKALFDAASAGIALIRDRVIQRCNQHMDAMFGYTPGEQIGHSTRIWFVDEDAFAAAGQEIYSQTNRGETHRREQLFVRRDGSRFWTRISAHALDPSRPETGLVAIIEDITAEREAAEALARSFAEQQAIFESATSGIVLIKDRVLQRCNRKLHEIFGWPIGEMDGKETRIWYPDEAGWIAGGGEVYAQLWRGETHRREQLLKRRDGSLFWARLTANAVAQEDPAKGSVWIIDDITAERATADEMRRATALAEEAARIKADFLANMSHEIRTPMNAIIGMTHLAQHTDLTPRQRDYLRKIQISSEHLLGIINDILDFSKIEAGKLSVESIPFELDRVLDNVAGLLGQKASAKGLEFIIDVAADVPPWLLGDPLRVGQVLANFTSNAVKFTERGEITLRVQVAQREGDAVVLRFTVQDSGIGLDAEQQRRLFRSFEQADTSTTRRYGGTGLGLVISKRLTELMGGEVGVDSVPGKGSRFWFTARFGADVACPAHSARPLPHPDLRGRRMLVVDDNEHSRQAITDMLQSMSFIVTACASGSEALEEIGRRTVSAPCEIAFIDWQMPGMSGAETATALRRTAPGLHLVIVAPPGPDSANAMQSVGADAFLTKPLTPSLVFDTVVRLIAGSEQAEHLPDTAPDTSLAGLHVLLAEDNEINQDVAAELLREFGCEVAIAGDGAIAVQMAEAGHHDVILMDMQMPNLDGLEATRKIRSMPGLDALPIIAMTANAMQADRERCLTAGMNDHIAKPVDPDALFDTLRRWCRPAARILPPPADAPAPYESEVQLLIPGIDTARGLKDVMGRRPLYLSLLHQFVRNQRDAVTRLDGALLAEDWMAAERIAHTLKGAAAQIGADALCAAAGRVESEVRDRGESRASETLRPSLAALAELLERLVDDMERALSSSTAADITATVETERIRELLSELARLLAADDFQAVAFFDANEAALRAVLGSHHVWISEAIHDFNYAAALDWLRSAVLDRGIEP